MGEEGKIFAVDNKDKLDNVLANISLLMRFLATRRETMRVLRL